MQITCFREVVIVVNFVISMLLQKFCVYRCKVVKGFSIRANEVDGTRVVELQRQPSKFANQLGGGVSLPLIINSSINVQRWNDFKNEAKAKVLITEIQGRDQCRVNDTELRNR